MCVYILCVYIYVYVLFHFIVEKGKEYCKGTILNTKSLKLSNTKGSGETELWAQGLGCLSRASEAAYYKETVPASIFFLPLLALAAFCP